MDFSNHSITDLAAIIIEHLNEAGIEVVLVGGLAVEIYTENLYLTKDIDIVNVNYQKPAVLKKEMSVLGFHKRGRIFVNDTTDICVEFPTAPLSVGDDLITETTTFKIGDKTIPILKVNDIVKDRLAAFIHWKDNQSLVQAVAIMVKHKLYPIAFESFCLKEGNLNNFELLQK